MARPNPEDYSKNELCNRCYELLELVERYELTFQGWQQDRHVEQLVGLDSSEVDNRIGKLKQAFHDLTSEKTNWMHGEALSIPLHPRHELKDVRATISLTIQRFDEGDSDYFEVIVAFFRENPLLFRLD